MLHVFFKSKIAVKVREQQAAGMSSGTLPSKISERRWEHGEPGRGQGCEPGAVHRSRAAGLKERGLR